MKLIRILSLGLAVLLPAVWTVAQAADPAPAGDASKKDKKGSKEGDTKTDTKKPQ